MVGIYLTPTVVLCNQNQSNRKMTAKAPAVGKAPSATQGAVRAGLLLGGHTSPRTGQSLCRCNGREPSSPKGRQGSCPNFNSLWDSWRTCGLLQPNSTCSAPALDQPSNKPASICKVSGYLRKDWATSLDESGHCAVLMLPWDSSCFTSCLHGPAEVLLTAWTSPAAADSTPRAAWS